MMTNNSAKDYSLSDDEKSASLIVYLNDAIIIGDAILKESIKFVSTWLRTNTLPANA